jgi:glutaredoxin-related protein
VAVGADNRLMSALVSARSTALPRQILDEAHTHPAIRDFIARNHLDLVQEVQAAVAANDVVVVGMGINPVPKKARRLLDEQGIPYKYLEYGSYLSLWRRRNALKMWTGWPTFPMIFVKGIFIGGASDLRKLIVSGELAQRLGRAQ